MNTPSFKEDHISQIPALQILVNLGYNYLSPDEALKQRNGKTTSVLLEGILRSQLEKINSITYKGNTFGFTTGNIQSAIQFLKDIPMQEGYMASCEYVYNLLTLGKSLEQSIDGDKKSYTIQFIDWQRPENNVLHVTEEYSVMRAGSSEHYRPDLVLFINGIPVCIIECKRPDMKDPLKQSISQHLRNQQDDGIRSLYVYAQMLLGIATNQALYATNATEEKYWNIWTEKFHNSEQEQSYNSTLQNLKNTPLAPEVKSNIFSERFRYVRNYFETLEQELLTSSEQDRYLYSLCRPERLLDFIFNFIVFETGIKKIARYPQYFALKKTMERIRTLQEGKRRGGVIWHTQGSGKSLTMVMLAQAIALDQSIKNPKIILVTDRVDLDNQITGTFIKCGRYVENATTGKKLLELLESASDAVITTIINKFETALKQTNKVFNSPDIFVLVDEGHRTQYGSFNIQMMKTLPNACFVAMTGTPLMKKEKNTAVKFGGLIDTYTVDKAVADGAVVPLLYEGRHALQDVNEKPIDDYFLKISEPLTEYQKTDLKKKFSKADQLNIADQKVYAIAWDISTHFRDNWQGTGLKGQLVCQSKIAAIRYKNYLDEIGIVETEVLISPPDEREGEESAYEKSDDLVKNFYQKMMNEHRTQKKYEENLISRFKTQQQPEIIIVVDKLLTGFDAPANTVLYLTRNLRDHSLLQAIARVNRVYPDKDFGYIIDYYGVLKELGEAMDKYTEMAEYDSDDLIGTLSTVAEEIKKLPQQHSELWDIFKSLPNKKDEEAYEQLLRDEAIRTTFYHKVSIFTRTLKLALSTLQFHKDTPEKLINAYKEDAAFFLNLRSSVNQRYSDTIDFSQYGKQLQKLIDKHITTAEVKPITELVNIFDKDEFNQELDKTFGAAARADTIASRTARHISESMDDDPAFYKKYSQMLRETIQAYVEKRISELEYLRQTTSIMDSVLSHTDKDIPEELSGNDTAKAFYGLVMESIGGHLSDETKRKSVSAESALGIDSIIQNLVMDGGKPIIDWQDKSNVTGKMLINIGDYLIDEVRDKYNITLSFDEIDAIAERCIEVAKRRYK
ncbi:MAG: type I restriction endonuclease subunit R [Ignavibacteriaceae bacterium]|nr:type I restriction endonuclease subunit R [Ignavibacteriaceae bacterium]